MLKNILNLEGAQQLSKNEQKNINGGKSIDPISPGCEIRVCPQGYMCLKGYCVGI